MDSNPLALVKTFLPEQAAAVEQAVAVLPGRRHMSGKAVPLGQFPDPRPEHTNPNALFRRGWLRKGGGGFIIAPSGVGKSVFTMQCAICWSLGRAAFGVEPVRPLKILVIQAEDDNEEVSEFRNCITRGLVSDFGFSEAEIRLALGWDDPATARVIFYKAVGKFGEEFVWDLEGCLNDIPGIDLVLVNPFQSYFGGDCSKNAELSQFFRGWVDPVIKDPESGSAFGNDRAGIIFVHHTNKPPSERDERENWGLDMFAAYIGAGGAEIVNWARCILSIMPTSIQGMFRLIAGKRGRRLGWVDVNGKPVYCRLVKHADDGWIFWREGTPADEEALRAAKEQKAGRRGAVGGDGSGGKPPDQTVYSPVTVLSYVDCHPGLSEKKYCDGLGEKPLEMSRSTVQRLLKQGVETGWLTVDKTPSGNRYDVTEKGRQKLDSCPL